MGRNRSVAFFQRVLDTHLAPYRAYCTPYVDDIFVYSHTFEDHCAHLRAVFRTLQRLSLTLSPAKCHIGYRSAAVLGHRTDGRLTWATDDKLDTIRSIAYPLTLQQLEHIIGFFAYYRSFVAYFAALSEPLERLKTALLASAPKTGAARKRYSDITRVPDDPQARQALLELKRILIDGVRLAMPDYTRPFILYVDASAEYGFGLAIHQTGDDGEFPVHFDSKRLSDAERRYQITELEAAAAAWALRKARRFIDNCSAGANGPLRHILFTDHSAVAALFRPPALTSTAASAHNSRLMRLSLLLCDFADRVEVRHRPGRYMAHVDALSRLQRAGATRNVPTPTSNRLFVLWNSPPHPSAPIFIDPDSTLLLLTVFSSTAVATAPAGNVACRNL